MKKHKTTIDEAIDQYTKILGDTPRFSEVTSLYYEYGKNWKQYDDFTDWYTYQCDIIKP